VTIHENLTNTRAMIEDESDWCMNALEDHKNRYCVAGALFKVMAGDAHCINWDSVEILRLNKAAENVFPEVKFSYLAGCKIVQINNQLGHKATLKCLDHAIAKATP